MRLLLTSVISLLCASCVQTTVTRLTSEGNQTESVHISWTENKLLFPLLIDTTAILPEVSESMAANKAFGDIYVGNQKYDDSEYNILEKPSSKDIHGAIKTLSDNSVQIDAYFFDDMNNKHIYPFSGIHRIKN